MTIKYDDPATILGKDVEQDGARRGTLGEFARDDSGRPDYVSAVVRQLLEDGLAFVPMEPPCECKKLCNKPRKGCPRRGWRPKARRDFVIRRAFVILAGTDYGMTAEDAGIIISRECGLVVNALRRSPLHAPPVDPPSPGTIQALWSKRTKRLAKGSKGSWEARGELIIGRQILFRVLADMKACDGVRLGVREIKAKWTKRAVFLPLK